MPHPVKLALVLHAHLPYVRELAPYSPQERWLHEAVWECYLPLLSSLDKAAERGQQQTLTLSISPTLAWMLDDPLLQRRFVNHLDQVRSVNEHQQRIGPQHLSSVRNYYEGLLEEAGRHWKQRRGDLLGSFRQHARAGVIELMSTSVTHAYLPGWMNMPSAVNLQLALSGCWPGEPLSSAGIWLPELAFAPGLDRHLRQNGVRYTLVDEHALRLALPPVRHGRAALSAGVMHLPRNSACNERVWSSEHGYPAHPVYREFHRDLGLYTPDKHLGELGCDTMTGLKYFRIGNGHNHELAYDPLPAQLRAWDDAADFLELVRQLGDHKPDSLIVAAYDAELFGHWWHEGAHFITSLLEHAHNHPNIELTTLEQCAAHNPPVALSTPAASSWGSGGFGQIWVGERTARWWRPLHEVQRVVRRAVLHARHAAGISGQALDRAIVEMLLMQASDWLFIIGKGGPDAAYAQNRLEQHGRAAHHFARMALNPTLASLDEIEDANTRSSFLSDVSSQQLRQALVE